MNNNQPFDPNNWCIKTNKTHPRWEEFVRFYERTYNSGYDFNEAGYFGSWDGRYYYWVLENDLDPVPKIHTIDEVLNYYNQPQVGDLCEFSDDGENWTNVATLHLIHDNLYWERISNSMYGRKYCRKVQSKQMPEIDQLKKLTDQFFADIQKIVESWKNK